MNSFDINVLKVIEAECSAVSEAQIQRIESKLKKPRKNEKPIGVVWNEACRRLMCASIGFSRKEAAEKVNASAAVSDEEERAHIHKASEYSTLSDLCKEILFAQIRDDLGIRGEGVGLRAGWMAVEYLPEEANPAAVIARLLGQSDEEE